MNKNEGIRSSTPHVASDLVVLEWGLRKSMLQQDSYTSLVRICLSTLTRKRETFRKDKIGLLVLCSFSERAEFGKPLSPRLIAVHSPPSNKVQSSRLNTPRW